MSESDKPSGSSIDAVQLSLGFDTEGVLGGAEAVDKLTDAVIKSTDSLIHNNDSLADNQRWLTESKRKWMELELQIKKESEALLEAERVQKAIASANDAQEKAAQNLIIKLNELVNTFGLSTEQMLRYKAAQLGIAQEAEPLIKKLEDMTRAQREATIQRERDIKVFEERVRAEKEASKEVLRIKKEEEAAWKQYDSFKEGQARREAALVKKQEELSWKQYEKHISDAKKAAAEAEAARKKEAEAVVALAEKQALDEIKWARLAADKKIKLIEDYNKALASGVRPEVAQKEAGTTAVSKNAGNLSKYIDEVKALDSAHAKGKHSADTFSEALGLVSFKSARARSELIVLAHEAVQGRFTRMPASMMVLAEYTNMASLAFSAIGQTILGVGVAMAALSVYVVKGILEQKEMADALIFTGEYAGKTTEGLMASARAASEFTGTIGEAKNVVTAIAQSGKIMGDVFDTIAQSITAVHAVVGREINDMIREFESLAYQANGHTKRAGETISINLVKLNDKYHFLTLQIYEQIRALELEGKQREASALAMTTYADELSKRAAQSEANLGRIEKGWHAVKRAVSSAVDAIMSWGKTVGPAEKMAELQGKVAAQEQVVNASKQMAWDPLRSMHEAKLANLRKELTATSKELLGTQERLYAQQLKQEQQYDAIHAAQAIRQKDAQIQKKSLGELAYALREWGEQMDAISKVDPNSPLLQQDAVNARYKALMEEHTKTPPKTKIPKGSDDRTALLREEISDIKQLEKIRLAAYKAQYDIVEQYNRLGIISDDESYESKKRILEFEEQAKVQSLSRQLLAIKDFNAKTKVEVSNANRMRKETESKITETALEEQAKRTRLVTQKQLDDQKHFQGLMENVGKGGANEVADLDKRIEKQIEYNAAIGKTKEAQDSARLATEQRKMLQNESDALFLEELLKDSSLTEEQVALFRARLVWLQRTVEKQKELMKLLGIAQKEDAEVAAAKLLSSQLDDAVNSAKRFGKSMKEAFGDTGEAIGGVIIALAEYNKRENDIFETKKKSIQLAGGDKGKERIAEQKAIEESQMNQLQTFGQMAGAAKGFFSEQSAGYKTMMGLQKVAHALQVAMMVKEMYLLAAKAVANQAAGGDPMSAWIRMAAMAAAMATLGYAVGGGFNRTGGQELSLANQRKTQNTGTILGDAEAKSESITKAIELLADNSDETMPVSLEMLKSLRAIESSMKALSSIVARTAGLSSGNPAGFQPSYEKKLGGIWGSKKVELEDAGLTINGVNIAQLIAGSGVNQYATTKTTEKSWFGLKKDINYDRFTTGTDADIQKQVSLVFKNLTNSLVTATKSFGFDGEHMRKYIESIRFDNWDVSLKDLKGDDLTDALNNWLSGMADDVVRLAFAGEPLLAEFQQVGEGAAETIVRVASGVEQASTLLMSLGIDTINWRDLIDKQGDVAAEMVRQSIVAEENRRYFTGVIKTIQTDSTFVQFEEYVVRLSGVGKIMQTLDGSASELVTTYKALLQVQRQLDNAGLGEISVAMLQGAGGISELGDSLDVFLDKFYTDKEKAERMQKNLADDFRELGVALPATRKDYKALVQVLARDTSEAGQRLLARVLALADSFDSTATAVENLTGTVEDGTQDIIDAWKGVTESIVDEIKRIRGEVLSSGPNGYAQASSAFNIASAQARAGDQEAAKQLPTLARDMLELAGNSAGSLEELNRIRIMTANSLEATAKFLEEKYGFDIPGFASGGDHVGGYRIVGENGPEIEATGPARIFSSQQSRAILNGETVQELRALRQEVAGLRAENQAQQVAIARNTEKMQKVLTRNDTGKGLLTTDTVE